MGWIRTFLLGDIGNRLDIEDTERDIAGLRKRLQSKDQIDQNQDQRLATLERDNAQLKLLLATLIRTLVRKGTLTRDELAAFVEYVDVEPHSDLDSESSPQGIPGCSSTPPPDDRHG